MRIDFSQKTMKEVKHLWEHIVQLLGNDTNHIPQKRDLLKIFLEKKSIKKTDPLLGSMESQQAVKWFLSHNIITEKRDEYLLESLGGMFSWIQKNSETKIEKIEKERGDALDFLKLAFGDVACLKVKIYEEIEGIKDSYRHILENAKGEICAYFSVIETQQIELQEFFEKEYSPTRAKKIFFLEI